MVCYWWYSSIDCDPILFLDKIDLLSNKCWKSIDCTYTIVMRHLSRAESPRREHLVIISRADPRFSLAGRKPKINPDCWLYVVRWDQWQQKLSYWQTLFQCSWNLNKINYSLIRRYVLVCDRLFVEKTMLWILFIYIDICIYVAVFSFRNWAILVLSFHVFLFIVCSCYKIGNALLLVLLLITIECYTTWPALVWQLVPSISQMTLCHHNIPAPGYGFPSPFSDMILIKCKADWLKTLSYTEMDRMAFPRRRIACISLTRMRICDSGGGNGN